MIRSGPIGMEGRRFGLPVLSILFVWDKGGLPCHDASCASLFNRFYRVRRSFAETYMILKGVFVFGVICCVSCLDSMGGECYAKRPRCSFTCCLESTAEHSSAVLGRVCHKSPCWTPMDRVRNASWMWHVPRRETVMRAVHHTTSSNLSLATSCRSPPTP